MSADSPGQRAVEAFEIDDVFLIRSDCNVNRDFNQTEVIPECGLQFSVSAAPEALAQVRTLLGPEAKKIFIIRYLVSGEGRLIKSEHVPESGEVDDKHVFATLRLTYAADYRCREEDFADREAIGAFVRNVVFHVWPFWREGAVSMAARMRLPRVTIPMNKPPTGPPGAPVSAKDAVATET